MQWLFWPSSEHQAHGFTCFVNSVGVATIQEGNGPPHGLVAIGPAIVVGVGGLAQVAATDCALAQNVWLGNLELLAQTTSYG